MPKFTVIVTETIEYTVEVDAADASAACHEAERMVIDTADRFERFDGRVTDRELEAITPDIADE